MANQNNDNKNQTSEQQQAGDVRGRTHNSQNPKFEQAGSEEDISAVDQQEGNLKHGETGGHQLKGEE